MRKKRKGQTNLPYTYNFHISDGGSIRFWWGQAGPWIERGEEWGDVL